MSKSVNDLLGMSEQRKAELKLMGMSVVPLKNKATACPCIKSGDKVRSASGAYGIVIAVGTGRAVIDVYTVRVGEKLVGGQLEMGWKKKTEQLVFELADLTVIKEWPPVQETLKASAASLLKGGRK